MEIDIDLNDKFIVDCVAEAENNQKRALAADDTVDADPREDAENMICQVEANKIQMLGTLGNRFDQLKYLESNETHFDSASAMQHSSLVDENYIVVVKVAEFPKLALTHGILLSLLV